MFSMGALKENLAATRGAGDMSSFGENGGLEGHGHEQWHDHSEDGLAPSPPTRRMVLIAAVNRFIQGATTPQAHTLGIGAGAAKRQGAGASGGVECDEQSQELHTPEHQQQWQQQLMQRRARSQSECTSRPRAMSAIICPSAELVEDAPVDTSRLPRSFSENVKVGEIPDQALPVYKLLQEGNSCLGMAVNEIWGPDRTPQIERKLSALKVFFCKESEDVPGDTQLLLPLRPRGQSA